MPRTRFSHVKISGISTVVPEDVINIDDELEFFNNDKKLLERNKKILGLGKRHVIDDRTNNTDLCEAAAKSLLKKLEFDKALIDTVIVASTSHDYRYPASACVIHGRLDLNEDCTCFDMAGLGCSAYVYALLTAHGLIASGASKNCLLLVSDLKSLHSDRRNRNSNMLFGDAAAATLLVHTDKDCPAYFCTGSRGKGWDQLIAPAGGYDIPIMDDIVNLEEIDSSGNVWHLWDDIMKGLEIFKFATEVGTKSVNDVLKNSGISKEQIEYFAFHQANKQIVRSIAMYLGIPNDKFSTESFSLYGNCGSASIVTDICSQLAGKNVGKICLSSFGVGLSYASCVLDVNDTLFFDIETYETPEFKMTRKEKINYWIDHFKGAHNAN